MPRPITRCKTPGTMSPIVRGFGGCAVQVSCTLCTNAPKARKFTEELAGLPEG